MGWKSSETPRIGQNGHATVATSTLDNLLNPIPTTPASLTKVSYPILHLPASSPPPDRALGSLAPHDRLWSLLATSTLDNLLNPIPTTRASLTKVSYPEILNIEPGSAAELAGLHVHQIIVQVNGLHIRSTGDLKAVLGRSQPGGVVTLDYLFKSNLGWMSGETQIALSK